MSTARAGYRLKFPAGRFEKHVVSVIIALQLAIVMLAFLTFVFWFYALPVRHEGSWHPEILALSVGMMAVAYLLSFLYADE